VLGLGGRAGWALARLSLGWLVGLTGLMGLAAPALAASVHIGSRQIVVTGTGARAVIGRSPFHISIDSGSGGAALSEVPNRLAGPRTVPPTSYPATLGGRPSPDRTVYAPLTFLVGSATTSQWTQAFWQGDELGGQEAGVQYSARRVVTATPSGDGLRLSVSTNDPTGRRLLVTVAAGPGRTIRVRTAAVPSTGVAWISDAFASGAHEAFHGFGGRHNAIDEHGVDFYSWSEQENTAPPAGSALDGTAAVGQPDYMFPNGPLAAYAPQALFYSSRPYGFLLDQPQFARWRMDSARPDAWRVDVYAPRLDYVVAPGTASRAIASLTSTTGRERVPPRWAIGPEIDRALRATKPENASAVAAEVHRDIANIDRHHIKLNGYRIEGWALLSRPVLASLFAELRARHIHPLVYFRSFVAQPTGGLDVASAFNYAIAHHYVATGASGLPATFPSPYQGGTAALIDFSNHAAVRWWQARINAALDAGADGFMQDFGDETASDWHFHDGETGATMHNRYPILYDRATRQGIDAYERRHPRRQIFFFTRSGYSGAPGSYAYDNANFLGDNTTSWDHGSGLASVLPDMLNRGVGGAYGSTTDIGGYEDLTTGKTTKALLLRWAELAALTPFYRLHNSGNAGTQMPWSFDPQTVAIYKRYAALHIAAEPLIMQLWRHADATGTPIMRPLWLDYAGDPTAAAQDEEWLLGPDVLVAPVVKQGATSRSVYFPRGCWRDPQTGRTVHGRRSKTVSAPLDKLPFYFRCGRHPWSA
jgi:sulfoquinovosidase